MTMRTVLMMRDCTLLPSTLSAMSGRASFTIMFATRRVTRSRWPFFLMGMIFLAYSRCVLGGRVNAEQGEQTL